MYKIAHISDPHVNRQFHPTHLGKLRTVLTHALEVGASHIVITGDLISDCDERDLKDCRKLFRDLGILNTNKLSVVIGNHDIYGGPHLAEDLMSFPSRCSSRDYDHHVAQFCGIFEELFYGTVKLSDAAFPYLKILGSAELSRPIALIGMNSVARPSPLKNPVGSNGKIDATQMDEIERLLALPDVHHASHRVALLHHHLFRKKDEDQFHENYNSKLMKFFEQETLKLRGKRKLLKLFRESKIDLVLHGHVHFTDAYERQGVRCLNGAGAVMPLVKEWDLRYNMISIKNKKIGTEIITIPTKRKAD